MARYEREPGFAYPRVTETHRPRPFRPEQYIVYRKVDDIAIDGKLDEESWALAPWAGDFGHIQSATAYARPPLRTRARSRRAPGEYLSRRLEGQ